MAIIIQRLLANAISAHQAGRKSEAAKLYCSILELQPDHPDTNHNLGILALDDGRPFEAEKLIQKALDLDPNVEQFWVSFIRIVCKMERYDEARKAIESMKLSDFSGDTLFRLERMINLLEEKQSSELSDDPSQQDIQDLTELFDQGKFQQVLDEAGELSRRFTSSLLLTNIEAASNAQIGNYGASIEQYRKIISLAPNYAEAHYNLGSVLWDMGDRDKSLQSYQRAVKIKPDYAEALNTIGVLMQDMRDSDEAIKYFKQAVAIDENFSAAYNNLGVALKSQGDINGATEKFVKALDLDPGCSSSKHMLAAMRGELTSKAPREYVEPLFDRFAYDFDDHLTRNLGYTIPQVFASLISLEFEGAQVESALDLGCGTGLSGKAIRECCNFLVGIDISRGMLEQARNKRIYDELSQTDMLVYLKQTELNFDLLLCLDALVYIGDLQELFELVKTKNKRSGYFGFSTEHREEGGVCLEKSGRYSHSKAYVEELCEKLGFDLIRFTEAPLRKEKKETLTGGVYLLKF